jgi:hypothetical protein
VYKHTVVLAGLLWRLTSLSIATGGKREWSTEFRSAVTRKWSAITGTPETIWDNPFEILQ